MKSAKKITLSAYMTDLLSKGQSVFTDKQAQQALGISKGALLDAAEKQQRKKQLITPRQGFYVIVSPQFLSWGAPPPPWFIDQLMKHEEMPYYVGLLKAAELHGATHQAVMEFQIITNKRLPRIKAGRSVIGFYYRKDMAGVTAGLQNHKTDTGTMRISGPELTILDLMRYPRAAAGIDHIATVLADLGERIDAAHLAELSISFERAVLQRLGYMLCLFGHEDKTRAVYERISKSTALPWVELEPALAADPGFSPEPVVRDARWHVTVRRVPEPDE